MSKSTGNKSQSSSKVTRIQNFHVGEYVVLPAHGVGKFLEYSEVETSNGKQAFYKVYFDDEKLTVMIPEANFANSGLRKIASKAIAEKVFEIFSKPPKNQRGIWSKRMQEYDAKIYSGVLNNLAEVTRDGFICSIDPNKSYTERSKYKTALHRVCQELSVVLGREYSDVEQRIISKLKAKQGRIESTENDDLGSDFDEMEMYDNLQKNDIASNG